MPEPMAARMEPVRRRSWSLLRRPLAAVFAAATMLLTNPVLPLFIAGAVVAATGLGLRVWARGCIRKNLEVTTAGPYRLTRNPLYLANLGIILGLVLIAGNLWLGLAAGVAFPLIFRHLAAIEERFLAGQFGPEYQAYRRAVPRFISLKSLLRRTPPVPGTGAFSWRRAGTELLFAAGLALWVAVAGLVGLGADQPMAFRLFALARKLLGC